MCIFELTAILDQHKIKHLVDNGRVLARCANHWIDITHCSRLQLARWIAARSRQR